MNACVDCYIEYIACALWKTFWCVTLEFNFSWGGTFAIEVFLVVIYLYRVG